MSFQCQEYYWLLTNMYVQYGVPAGILYTVCALFDIIFNLWYVQVPYSNEVKYKLLCTFDYFWVERYKKSLYFSFVRTS